MKVRHLLLVCTILLGACKSRTIVDRHTTTTMPLAKSGDAVVVLGRTHGLGGPADKDFVECVSLALEKRLPALAIIAEDAFVDTMYPWFETSTAPTHVSQLNALFENEAVRARFDEKRIQYLIWITGRTETVSTSGSVTCAVGPGGGGCFGMKSWDDEADYEAALWQVDTKQAAAMIATRTSGTSYVPALILPLPLLARVKDAACGSMAGQLASALDTGISPSGEQKP